jgi:small subunit ribosomal protein S1
MPTDETTTPEGSLPAASPETTSPAEPATAVEAKPAETPSNDASAATEAAPPAAASGEAAPPAEAGGEAAAPAVEGAATPEGEKKKRRRRRKRKKDGTATAEGAAAGGEGGEATEGDEGSDDDAEGDAEGASEEGGEAKGDQPKSAQGAQKKRDKKPQPHREKPPFAVGEEVAGKVTKVMADAIMVDVAGKALGIVDRAEIPESETPAEGEKFIAKIANDGARGGLVVLTKDLNRWQKARGAVELAFTHKQTVPGLITGVIKGGVEVDVDGLRGFAPASQVELRLGADLHHLIGQKFPFDVIVFAKRGREFVLSRKSMLEGEAKKQREEALSHIEVGKVVTGTVRSVKEFGVFVDVGGVDGMVHVSEASHTGVPMHEVFKVGEQVQVKILRVDEKGKIWLSRKAAEHDPWDGAAERYARGTRHKGKVVRLQPFGAFVELEPGIDALLHASDMISAKRFMHPSEVMAVGDELDVIVAQADIAHRKIALHPAPKEGEVPAENVGRPPPRLAPHAAVKVIVEGHEPGGAGIMVTIVGQTGRNAKGFIGSFATGTPKGADLRKAFPVGKELEAKVVEMDPRKGIKLSIKALAQDQERQSFKAYQNEVKQTAKFGTFGDLLAKKGIGTK